MKQRAQGHGDQLSTNNDIDLEFSKADANVEPLPLTNPKPPRR